MVLIIGTSCHLRLYSQRAVYAIMSDNNQFNQEQIVSSFDDCTSVTDFDFHCVN